MRYTFLKIIKKLKKKNFTIFLTTIQLFSHQPLHLNFIFAKFIFILRTIRLKCTNLKETRQFKSDTVTNLGIEWFLKVYIEKSGDDDNVSVYLHATPVSSTWLGIFSFSDFYLKYIF